MIVIFFAAAAAAAAAAATVLDYVWMRKIWTLFMKGNKTKQDIEQQ